MSAAVLPPDTATFVGKLGPSTLGQLGRKAAGLLSNHPGEALTVTLDPEGRVFIEPPGDAAETDIVGTYRGSDDGWLVLGLQIIRDLRHELQLRRMKA